MCCTIACGSWDGEIYKSDREGVAYAEGEIRMMVLGGLGDDVWDEEEHTVRERHFTVALTQCVHSEVGPKFGSLAGDSNACISHASLPTAYQLNPLPLSLGSRSETGDTIQDTTAVDMHTLTPRRELITLQNLPFLVITAFSDLKGSPGSTDA